MRYSSRKSNEEQRVAGYGRGLITRRHSHNRQTLKIAGVPRRVVRICTHKAQVREGQLVAYTSFEKTLLSGEMSAACTGYRELNASRLDPILCCVQSVISADLLRKTYGF